MPDPAPRPVPASRRRLALALVASLGLATLAAGCGGSGTTTSPTPDCSGTHLVVMTSGRNLAAGQTGTFLYDLDAGGFRALLGFGGTGQDRHPAITLDGKAIAVVRPGTGGGQHVYVYERCAGAFLDRPELVSSGEETDPAFSGDTKLLTFVRDSAGVKRVRLYDGLSRRFLPLPGLDSLAAADGGAAQPTLDRYGNTLAFVTGSAPTRQIVVYSRTTNTVLSAVSSVVNSANDQRDPWLTPDARYLAFASDRPGGVGAAGTYDIYMVDLQANAYVALDSLNSDGNDARPSLSADGNIMAFQSDRTGDLAKGKWDLYLYVRSAKAVGQGFQFSSTEDDIEPYLAYP